MGSKITKIVQSIPAYQPTIVVLVAILYLTLLPKPLGEEDISLFDGADKVVHFIMFGGLSGTYIFDRYRMSHPLTMRGALLTALVSALLGALVEYLQYAMNLGRTGNDIYDALANALGAFCAVAVCRLLRWTKSDRVNIIIDNRT